MANLFTSFISVDSLNHHVLDTTKKDTISSLLTYRMRNVVRIDAEFDIGKFTFGYTVVYNGFMDKIDEIFNSPTFHILEYIKYNNKGYFLMDARMVYKITDKSSISLIVKNMTNKEYTLRPAMLEAPRSFVLQYKIVF